MSQRQHGKTANSIDGSNAGIGASLPRVEDDALLRGRGSFIDDLHPDNLAYAGFLRSPHASAEVTNLNLQSARELSGAIAAFGPDDLEPGRGPATAVNKAIAMPSGSSLKNADGSPILSPDRPVLTRTARFVGDTLAMVIGETPDVVEAMLEAIEISFKPRQAVIDAQDALVQTSELVWPQLGTNCALQWTQGERDLDQELDEISSIFDKAAHRISHEIVNNRVMLAALEPRGALAQYDKNSERYTLWTPTQGGNQVKREVARALSISPDTLRVITPDVGGGFGIKNGAYPEQVLVVYAAHHVGRSVKWYASRSDAFLCDYHARDHVMRGELALDADGRFIAIRSDVISNMGAYLTGAAPIIPTTGGTRMLANVYLTPYVFAHTRCVYTNTAPITAYRGAGKPEYAHLVETLIDVAARKLNMDAAELRRRNLITPNAFPYTTPTGLVYDSGDFTKSMANALALAETPSQSPVPREDAREDAGEDNSSITLVGRGFSVYTEPDGYMDNRAQLSFDAQGRLTVITSAQTNGQGHPTTYTQIAHSLLGVNVDDILVIEGDTDLTGPGSGSGGSRSTTVTGAAMHACAHNLIEQGKRLAAHLLEASEQDIEFSKGHFTVSGTDRRVNWATVSSFAHDRESLPSTLRPGLAADDHYHAPVYCYPSGCHVCDLAIDRDTGVVTITRYLSVSDFGTVVNPMLVAGQLHGGIAQGIGQALYERTVYDADSGQLTSGSFMDYCIPRATQLPAFEEWFESTHCLTNPLGVKGCGESGPTCSLPAIENAVMDALRDYDTRDLKMPFTPERIWRVINAKA